MRSRSAAAAAGEEMVETEARVVASGGMAVAAEQVEVATGR